MNKYPLFDNTSVTVQEDTKMEIEPCSMCGSAGAVHGLIYYQAGCKSVNCQCAGPREGDASRAVAGWNMIQYALNTFLFTLDT